MTAEEILHVIDREHSLFVNDVNEVETELRSRVQNGRFLVLGGAGSIGQAVSKEIFKRNPRKLHIVDLSENNLVELVRDLRSSIGYIDGDFKTFALDIGSVEYDAMIAADGEFDYVLNLSALKHVRSEKDPFTLMRMIDVNINNTVKTIKQSIAHGVRKYFCVSTDKAANPVNMMGASKRIMELHLWKYTGQIAISTARFANVAFSDGSLLQGFNKRLEKKQPIVAPNDISRYFVTPQESGELCLMSCIFGDNGDTFFPQENDEFQLTPMRRVAERFLEIKGFKPHPCNDEAEARSFFEKTTEANEWPCYFPVSDTTGEKPFEEFYTSTEVLDLDSYSAFGIIKNDLSYPEEALEEFGQSIRELRSRKNWSKEDIVVLFEKLLPAFRHDEKGKSLDNKM